MKKIYTLLLSLAALAMPALAKDYPGTLSVTVDGANAEPTQSTISIDKNTDGTYKLSLHNFILYSGGESMAIGNIDIDNVAATTDGDIVWLKTSQSIAITAGDDVSETWYGPMLTGGEASIPVEMTGRLKDGDFSTLINIEFAGMEIKVNFTTSVFQIPNSNFESFHTATYGSTSSDEPNNWHSFMSCSGTLASFVSGTPHTFISEEVRPNSTGTKSVKLTSGIVKVSFISTPANGTLTTGRLQAGSTTATDTKNCSFLDVSSKDTDANGDPFFARLVGHPDSLKVWVKFKQGTLADKNKAYKYATVSAAITDGTYYQDPEDKTYGNVAAKAKNNTIESKDAAWQELNVPFDYASYTSNGVEPQAILVTFSTNAQPGVGSTDSNNPDELYIDDLSLVYNSKLASLSVKGTAVEGFDKDTKEYSISVAGTISADDIAAVADGQGAYVVTTLEEVEGGQKATIDVYAEDLSSSNTYTLSITNTSTNIKSIDSNAESAAEAIYSIDGVRVKSTSQKGIYVVKQANGKTMKVVKK